MCCAPKRTSTSAAPSHTVQQVTGTRDTKALDGSQLLSRFHQGLTDGPQGQNFLLSLFHLVGRPNCHPPSQNLGLTPVHTCKLESPVFFNCAITKLVVRARIVVEMGSHLTEIVPVQSLNSFLNQRP